jgi:hypothetical protein
MAKTPQKWKDRDVKRLVRQAEKLGYKPTAIELDPQTGRIKMAFAGDDVEVVDANPWTDMESTA